MASSVACMTTAVHAKLVFKIPATYPDVVPEVKVEKVKDLVASQCDALRKHILEKVSYSWVL